MGLRASQQHRRNMGAGLAVGSEALWVCKVVCRAVCRGSVHSDRPGSAWRVLLVAAADTAALACSLGDIHLNTWPAVLPLCKQALTR